MIGFPFNFSYFNFNNNLALFQMMIQMSFIKKYILIFQLFKYIVLQLKIYFFQNILEINEIN